MFVHLGTSACRSECGLSKSKYVASLILVLSLSASVIFLLTWKSQVSYIAKKIKRNIGILSKLRYYVNSDILVKLYYALIYPFLRTVPTFVNAHTFCASRNTRTSYGLCLVIKGNFCAV